MRRPSGQYATEVWSLLQTIVKLLSSHLLANLTYWSVIGGLYDFEVQLDKSCLPCV